MKYINVADLFVVKTDDKAEREKFKNTLSAFPDRIMVLPAPNNAQPAPPPAEPTAPVTPDPDKPPVITPDEPLPPVPPDPTTPPPDTTPPPAPDTGTTTPPGMGNIPAGGSATPRYHATGLYWTPPRVPGKNPEDPLDLTDGVKVEYKRNQDAVWKRAHNMWYDARNNQCRSMIFGLEPNTAYNVRFSMPNAAGTGYEAPAAGLTFSTWADAPPEDPVKNFWTNGAESATRTITQGGTAQAYKVYGGPVGGKTTITVPNAVGAYGVVIDADYVILRRVKTVGGQMGIRIAKGRHHVFIDDCEATEFGRDWGRVTSEGWRWAWDGDWGIGGVWTEQNAPEASRLHHITIQRCKVHTPKFGANTWRDGHPKGCNGISLANTGGFNVVRYNEVYSNGGESRWFMDAIGGNDNFSATGFPGNDSDIYKNHVRHAWDDGIEAEGGMRCVGVWGNYCDEVMCPIATTSINFGPAYVFRNVTNRQRTYFHKPHDQDNRNYAFKTFSVGGWGGGRRYVYHNTLLQLPGAIVGATFPLGAGMGLSGTTDSSGSTQPILNTRTRNNILQVWRSNRDVYYNSMATAAQDKTNSFDYDLYNGEISVPSGGGTHLAHAIFGTPTYKAGHGPATTFTGKYQLAAGTSGHNAGQVIPNINDGYLGAAPDMGAHEEGTADMVVGVLATGS